MMIREQLELRETEILSPYASFSRESRGREREEEECDIRPVFQRDRDRILHSKAFRRLRQKTQVFYSLWEIIIGRDLPIRWRCHRMQERLPRHSD